MNEETLLVAYRNTDADRLIEDLANTEAAVKAERERVLKVAKAVLKPTEYRIFLDALELRR